LRNAKIKREEKQFIETHEVFSQGVADSMDATKEEAQQAYLISHRWARSGAIDDGDLDKLLSLMYRGIKEKKSANNIITFSEGFKFSLQRSPDSQKQKVGDMCLIALDKLETFEERFFCLKIISVGKLKCVKEKIGKYKSDKNPKISEYVSKIMKKLE
jgi:hypothetical protein